MTDDRTEQDHWQALAEQLGLTPEPGPSTVPAQEAESKKATTEVSATGGERVERLPPAFEKKGSPAETGQHVDNAGRDYPPNPQEDGSFSPERKPAEHRARERSREPERAGSGKGRRRKPAAAPSPPSGETAFSEGAAKDSARHRGKRRSKKAETETAMEPEVDSEELDTLSDWSAPSWTEIIDSLYRPDR